MTGQMEKEIVATAKVEKTVSMYQLRSMLCNAFEGGVGYWCAVDSYVYADGLVAADFKKDGKFNDKEDYFHPTEIIPTIEGCGVKLVVTEGVSAKFKDEWKPTKADKERFYSDDCNYVILTKEKLLKGIQLMADKHPRHFNDWMEQNDDATTGDVLLQLALFGEIIFG